jgi:hypothetical protein
MLIKERINDILSRGINEYLIATSLSEEELNLDLSKDLWPIHTKWWSSNKNVYWVQDLSNPLQVLSRITTLKDRLELELAKRGENIISMSSTFTEEELNWTWLNDNRLPLFTAWSDNYVFFPVAYSNSKSIEARPRHPL